MIKGCNKRVIVMHDTGNAMIEEAIFIIKPGADKGVICEDDIIKHANSILDRNASRDRLRGFQHDIKQKKKSPFAPFLTGMVFGAFFAALVILVF